MKKKIFALAFATLLLSAFSSCSKDEIEDSDQNGANQLLITEGFLSTIGKYYSGALDTLTYSRANSTHDLSEYGYQYRDIYAGVSLENNSNGTVSIKRKNPYVTQGVSYFYFSIIPTNPGASNIFPNNPYQYGPLKAEKSDATEFIVKRDNTDRSQFTIESKKYPGYYLDVERWLDGGTNGEQWLVFTTKPQLWFFIND